MMIFRKNLFILLAIIAIALCIVAVWLHYIPSQESETLPENRLSLGLISTDASDQWSEELINQVNRAGLARGIRVTVIETEQTQWAQMDAIRSLISYNVDAIIFCPIMEKGWNYVVQEASEAGVAIVSLNQELVYEPAAGVENNVFYITYDYEALSYRVANEVSRYLENREQSGLAAVELKGTIGSSVSDHLSKGLRSALEEVDCFSMNYSTNANNMRSRGREVVRGLLRTRHDRMDIVVAHNDGMALGALDAIKESGLVPGEDVLIVAFGGGELLKEAYGNGEVLCVGYCDLSLIGETVIDHCVSLRSGESPFRLTYGYSTVLIKP